LSVAGNDRQDVVKIMGNASRKATNGFYLLRLPKLLLKGCLFFFCLLALGNVPDNASKSYPFT